MSYPPFPSGTPDEVELYLRRLAFLPRAVLRKPSGITEEQSRWQPDGKLIPPIGIHAAILRGLGQTVAETPQERHRPAPGRVRELLDGTIGE